MHDDQQEHPRSGKLMGKIAEPIIGKANHQQANRDKVTYEA